MRKFLIPLPPKLQLFLIVSITIVVSFVMAVSTNRLFDPPVLTVNLDLVTSVYQVLGTLYAVLVAFAVSGVWQNFSKATLAVQTEANAIFDLVRLIEYSAIEQSKTIRHLALDYLRLVVEKEWNLLGEITADESVIRDVNRTASIDITHNVLSLKPASSTEMVIFSQILSLLNNWLDARRTRILIAKGNSARALWPLLIFGALLIFGFHGLFVIKMPKLWALLLLAFSLLIGLCFFLIFTLDCPFTGKPFVDYGPFKWAIHWLEVEKFDSLMADSSGKATETEKIT